MTPPYSTNSSSSPFPFELNNEADDHHDHQNHTLINFTTPNYHVASSSSSHSQQSHLFLNSSSWDHQPQYYDNSNPQLFYPQQHKVTSWRSNNNQEENCEDNNEHAHGEIVPVKWMSSKMRVMQKMKGSDRAAMASATTTITATAAAVTATITTKIEDEKRASSSLESEHSSNSSSNHSTNNNVPIRVCADCNTTKTPLWRSGPKGPKSLCNACGIRQRKARRAMAAAANCTAVTSPSPSLLKIKVKPTKEKAATVAKTTTAVNHHHHHVTPFKKRVAAATVGSEQAKKKQKVNGFEDFLIKLSKNSAYHHRVFPQDEKDAAILLMALSWNTFL